MLVVGVSTEVSVATLGDYVLVFDDAELVSVLQGNTFLFVVGVTTEHSVATLGDLVLVFDDIGAI